MIRKSRIAVAILDAPRGSPCACGRAPFRWRGSARHCRRERKSAVGLRDQLDFMDQPDGRRGGFCRFSSRILPAHIALGLRGGDGIAVLEIQDRVAQGRPDARHLAPPVGGKFWPAPPPDCASGAASWAWQVRARARYRTTPRCGLLQHVAQMIALGVDLRFHGAASAVRAAKRRLASWQSAAIWSFSASRLAKLRSARK